MQAVGNPSKQSSTRVWKVSPSVAKGAFERPKSKVQTADNGENKSRICQMAIFAKATCLSCVHAPGGRDEVEGHRDDQRRGVSPRGPGAA